jgi:hypothetical protein
MNVNKRDARQLAIVLGCGVTNEAERMAVADQFAAMLYPPGSTDVDAKIIEFVDLVERAAANPQDYANSLPAVRSRVTWAEDMDPQS